MGILRDCWQKEGSLQVVCATSPPATTTLAYHGRTTSMQSHLWSHHPDKYGESSKESWSQRKLDSFVHAKKCSAECAEEITSRRAEMVASIVEGVGFKYLLSPGIAFLHIYT